MCQSNLHNATHTRDIHFAYHYIMSGLTQGFEFLSVAGPAETQSTFDSQLENADAARLLQSATESVSLEEFQNSIVDERDDTVRDFPSMVDSHRHNGNDELRIDGPLSDPEVPLSIQPADNSQQNPVFYSQYSCPPHSHGYLMPSNQMTYPAMVYPNPQLSPGQNYTPNYPAAYYQYSQTQYVAQALPGPNPPTVLPQCHNGYPSHVYQQGYPVQVLPQAPPPVVATPSAKPRHRHPKNDQERRHACTFCPAKFARPSALLTHVRTHTKETPFPCRFANCERKARAFSVKSNRTRHEGIHVREGMEVPLEVLHELNAKRARNGQQPVVKPVSS